VCVYVDNMRARFGRMIMCHMIADTTDELLSMCDKIDVARKWIQNADTPREHFDIALSKRALAIKLGAISITLEQCGCMVYRRKRTGNLGDPSTSVEWYFK
jgi:hypothetical protein